MVPQYSSKLDLNQGYHQLPLHPDSRHITTSLSPLRCLDTNVSFSAAEMFQDVIVSAISDIPSVKNISDDVIIYGANRKEHNKTLHAM